MEKKKDIPEGYWDSPLGIIPKGWEVKRVSEVFVPLHTFSFSRDQMTLNRQKLHYIHYGDIHVNVEKDYVDLKKDQLPYVCDGLIPDEKLKSEDFPYLKNGDILLADASEDYDGVGKPWELIDISNQKVIGGLHTLALRSYTGDVVVGFGRYIFKNSLGAKFLKRIAQGTKVYAINFNFISKLNIVLPPAGEQYKIMEILSLWDKAILTQSTLIEKLELRKKGLMQQLLTGKKRLKQYDRDWKEIKLGDVFQRVVRKNSDNHSNVVTISAQRGFIKQIDFFNKLIASEVIEDYYLVKKDEFCYNKSYSKGYPMGVIKRLKEFDVAVVTTLYICFSQKKEVLIEVDFFEQYFELGLLNQGLVKIANEGGRAHGLLNVNAADFFDLRLFIPPLAEQKAIAEILSSADQEIILAKQKLEFFKAQKKGLMQQLLTGKMRVKPE